MFVPNRGRPEPQSPVPVVPSRRRMLRDPRFDPLAAS